VATTPQDTTDADERMDVATRADRGQQKMRH
jgi:hypothetical protein